MKENMFFENTGLKSIDL
ncbi:MAG: hypothetical protein DSY98_02075 [SAR324 cluster bacterium]|uniref:Uncharacterized protein n=2 Tax=SAR324 cluster bacterium TaxID=2024889 RepID=A0A432GF23_9DELT|nr:MAG: hypothetical protein DSY98_02075 [SAR324 cluster bacterium]HIM44102.1 hypothetical protein [Deltaproteobacteria bacterium]